MTVNPTDPEAVALVEQLAALLDPTDAVLVRRTVLDPAASDLAAIAAEVGMSPAAVRARCAAFYGELLDAIARVEALHRSPGEGA